MMTLRAAVCYYLLLLPALAVGDEPRPAMTIRAEKPDAQAQAIIDLFRGSRAAHPAAALAAWKRASPEPNRLGKPVEALIAAINPGMVRELGALDDAEVAFWFEPETGRVAWGASLPRDDGTFAALATALVLSGGAAEEPLGGLAVDRLGPEGSALMARAPGTLLLGGSRDGLAGALARSGRPIDRGPGDRLRLSLEPGALEGSRSLAIRRLRAALGEPGQGITGAVGLDGSSLRATLDLAGKRSSTLPVVDPGWLAWVPADRTFAAFFLAIDPGAENWEAAFQLADRVERVDPVRENVAPLRLRLGLLARTLGIRTDADLLPHLRGISGWLRSDGSSVEGAFLMLHLDDEAAAGRIVDGVKPPPNAGPDPGPRPGGGRWLGLAGRRPVRLFRLGRSIAVTWGDGVMEAVIEARDHPDRSAWRALLDESTGSKAAWVALAWPGRVPGLIARGSPLAQALDGSPPITWAGRWQGPDSFHVEMDWKDLDATVKRFLDLIPLDPPPDR